VNEKFKDLTFFSTIYSYIRQWVQVSNLIYPCGLKPGISSITPKYDAAD